MQARKKSECFIATLVKILLAELFFPQTLHMDQYLFKEDETDVGVGRHTALSCFPLHSYYVFLLSFLLCFYLNGVISYSINLSFLPRIPSFLLLIG